MSDKEEINFNEDLKKEEKKIQIDPEEIKKEGITTEDFDIKKDIKETDISDQELNEKEGIFVKYTLKEEEVVQSLKKFHKITLYKKNYIYTFLLLIIFVTYMFNYMNNPENSMSMFLGAISVAVIGVVWYTPLAHVKKMGKAISENEDIEFTLTVFDNCLKTGEGESAIIIDYDKYKITSFETENAINIGVGKERVFIIPKRCLEDNKEKDIKKILKDRFKEKYVE